jgi:hypothetical protein
MDTGEDTQPRICASLRAKAGFFPSAKRLGVEFWSCWRQFFSFFPKIMDWEGLLGTLGDALRAILYNEVK